MGGATAGLLAAGLEVEVAYDVKLQEVEAHRVFHPHVRCEVRNVATIHSSELAGRFTWASPPCQPWSFANTTRLRGPEHPAYYSLAYLVEQARESAVLVIENVAGLAWSAEGRRELAAAEAAAQGIGRTFQAVVLSAAEYGVPQWRRRAVLVVGAPLVLWPRGVVAVGTVAAVTAKHSPPGLSLVECGRLQGVPIPPGVSRSLAHRLIGNAVPPAFGEVVVGAVRRALAAAV